MLADNFIYILQVNDLMEGSGYQRDAESYQNKFLTLYGNYKLALDHNESCTIKTRKRPPCYFKFRSLFADDGTNAPIEPGEY